MPIFLLQRIWIFVKKYWYVFACIIAGIFLLAFTHKTPADIFDMLKSIMKRHDDELAAVKKAQEDEIAKRDAALKKYEETLEQVQKHYDEAQKELDSKKKAEVAKIVKESGDDPDELARRLQESTGFKIVLPESDK